MDVNSYNSNILNKVVVVVIITIIIVIITKTVSCLYIDVIPIDNLGSDVVRLVSKLSCFIVAFSV